MQTYYNFFHVKFDISHVHEGEGGVINEILVVRDLSKAKYGR